MLTYYCQSLFFDNFCFNILQWFVLKSVYILSDVQKQIMYRYHKGDRNMKNSRTGRFLLLEVLLSFHKETRNVF